MRKRKEGKKGGWEVMDIRKWKSIVHYKDHRKCTSPHTSIHIKFQPHSVVYIFRNYKHFLTTDLQTLIKRRDLLSSSTHSLFRLFSTHQL